MNTIKIWSNETKNNKIVMKQKNKIIIMIK